MKVDTQSVLILPKEAYLNRLIGMQPVQAGVLTLIEAKLFAGQSLTVDSVSDFLAAHGSETRAVLSQFFRIDENGALVSDVVEAGRAIAAEIETEEARRAAVYAARSEKGNRARWGKKRPDSAAVEGATAKGRNQEEQTVAQKSTTQNGGQPVDKSGFSVDKLYENWQNSENLHLLKDSFKDAEGIHEGVLKEDNSQENQSYAEASEPTVPDSLEKLPSGIPKGSIKDRSSDDSASRASNYSRVRTCEERSKDKDRKEEDDHHHPYGVTMLRARGFVDVDNYAEEIEEISSRISRTNFEKVVDRVIKTKREKEGRSVEEIHMPYLLKSLHGEIRQKELAKSNDETVHFTPRKPAYNPDEEEKELQRKNALALLDRYFAEGQNPYSSSILPDPDDPEAKDFDFEPSYVQRVMAERERWEREGRAEEGREAARLEKLQMEAELVAAVAREEGIEKASQKHGITW